MANCPNCGSNHIQLTQDTNVNWGRAVVGYALFGVVGGAVGAVTGEDKNINVCLDCGTSWNPRHFYEISQLIKNTTGETLDLAIEEDRSFMNDFIRKIIPCLEAIPEINKNFEKRIKETEATLNKEVAGSEYGCGCLFLIIFVCTIGSLSGVGAVIYFILIVALPTIVLQKSFRFLEKSHNKNLIKSIKETKKEWQESRTKAEFQLELEITQLMQNRSK